MDKSTIELTREIRLGLHETDSPSAAENGFAANPILLDIAPFLVLRATLRGPIDPATGMLINIKTVDAILRRHGVPLLRRGHYTEKIPVAALMPRLFQTLSQQFASQELHSIQLALSPFLSLTVIRKEPHMVRLSQRFEFSAAHRLHSDSLSEKQNQELFGRCNNPNGHGHNYELEVTVAAAPDQNGQVLPVPILQKIVKEKILDQFDHKHLNLDCPEFRGTNPTVENIARIIYERLSPAVPAPARLTHIRVWETPKTVAEYGKQV